MDLPSLFIANAGTPLMWAGCGQLVFGNALLGVFESWLLRKRYKSAVKSPGRMIWANYASMAAGFFLIWASTPVRELVKSDPLRLGMPLVVALWILAFVVTALVEWPFVAKTAGLAVDKKSLLVSVGLQSLSYIALLPLVLFVGSLSALISLKPAKIDEISTVGGWVYYVGRDNVTVKRTRLDGSITENVMRLPEPLDAWRGRITVEPVKDGETANLMYRDYGDDRILFENIGRADQAAPVERWLDDTSLAAIGNGTFGFESTRKFVVEPTVGCGFWSREGMSIDGKNYALETPFLALDWRCPVVLPDGKVLVQFGDAILLIDPQSERAVRLCEGSGGDVLLDP